MHTPESVLKSRSLLTFIGGIAFFCFLYIFPQTVFAADLRATNSFPLSGNMFYDTESITFRGIAENIGDEDVVEGGWVDIEIDWNSDGTFDSANAYGGAMLGSIPIGSESVRGLEYGMAPLMPVGNHQYRFNVDSTNLVPDETDELNNRSVWVPFSVVPTPYAPTITMTASPNPVIVGSSTSLSWTVSNAASCIGSSVPSGWSGAKSITGGSEVLTPATTTVYTLECTSAGGSAIKNFTVNVVPPPPSVSLSLASNLINIGSSTSLSWTVSNAASCIGSSVPSGWSGAKSITGGSEVVAPTATTTYTLDCSNLGGSTRVSRTLAIRIPPTPPLASPTVNFSASPTSIRSGATSTLTWSTSGGATRCVASGGWSGAKDPAGGTQIVSTTVRRDYTLSCGAPGMATTTRTVTIRISDLPDLVPQQFPSGNFITYTTPTLEAGITTQFQAQVYNRGGTTTPTGFTDRFRLIWGWVTGQIVGYAVGPALMQGATRVPADQSSSTVITHAGLLQVEYCADQPARFTDPVINESDNNNNCVTREFQVPGNINSPQLTLTVTPTDPVDPRFSRITAGATATISWNAVNATECVAVNSGGLDTRWSGRRAVSGSVEVTPLTLTNYAMTCTGPGGSVVQAVRVYVRAYDPQILVFRPNPTSVVRGGSVQIDWSVASATACTASSTPATSWGGARSKNGGSETVNAITRDTIFRLTCTSPTGTARRQFTVGVYDLPPQLDLSVSTNPIIPGQTTQLSWISQYADSCVASDGWSGMKPLQSGSPGETVSPAVTTMYTLTCSNGVGSVSRPVTVTVSGGLPEITLETSDNQLTEGEPARLTWTVSGATSCSATEGSDGWSVLTSAALLLGGSKDVAPTTDTKYVLTCESPWGRVVKEVNIRVIPKAYITEFMLCPVGSLIDCSFAGETRSVNPGALYDIYWSATNASFCSAVSGYRFTTRGRISGTDPVMMIPASDAEDTYTLVCGTGAVPTSQASINVRTNSNGPEITVSKRVVTSGEEVTVSWDTNNDDQSLCSIRGGGLTNEVLVPGIERGSRTVTITGKTTFMLTCDAMTDIVTVELNPVLWES